MARLRRSENANQLLEYLAGGCVFTSSELIEHLKTIGITDDNARQILRRNANTKGIWRSDSLRLPKNERLFAQRSIVGTPAFYRAIGLKLGSVRRVGLAQCLAMLGERCVLHKIDAMRLLAVSPERNHSEPRAYERELPALKEVGARIVHRNTPLESIIGPTVVDQEDIDALAMHASASVRREALLARVLVETLRRQNMVSWNRVEFPDSQNKYTIFNDHVFSTWGFSYLSPLVRWQHGQSKPVPCPVLIDVYGEQCHLPQVESFHQRIQRATSRGRSTQRSLGVIAAKNFRPDAWTFAREKGLMSISFRQVFGDEALEAMTHVEELLHGLSTGQQQAEFQDMFEKFSDILNDLKVNPVVSTLRSIGLEALTGMILASCGYQSIEIGRIVPWEQTRRDVDVFGFLGDELRIVECKAYHRHKSLLPEDVTKFFSQTVPATKRWLSKCESRFTRCRAEIWTTGPVGERGEDELSDLKKKMPKNDEWHLLHGDKIRDLAPQRIKQRSSELIDAIRLERTIQPSDDFSGEPRPWF